MDNKKYYEEAENIWSDYHLALLDLMDKCTDKLFAMENLDRNYVHLVFTEFYTQYDKINLIKNQKLYELNKSH